MFQAAASDVRMREKYMYLCECWGPAGEVHKGSAQFSQSSMQTNLWTHLSPLSSLLIPPVSLLSLASSTFHLRG